MPAPAAIVKGGKCTNPLLPAYRRRNLFAKQVAALLQRFAKDAERFPSNAIATQRDKRHFVLDM
jgi:hypothetical protein